MGGQVADHGTLTAEGLLFAVSDVQKNKGGKYMHTGMLQKGVLIRHLILPEQGENSKRVIDWVSETFQPDEVLFSLMSQYTPMGNLERFPELRRPVSPALDAEIYDYLMQSRIENGFYQDLESATGDMIPKFDQTGV